MAKSLRSKREKRLRAIRRDLVEPVYQKKEEAKLATLEAALAAPKIAPKIPASSSAMDALPVTSSTIASASTSNMDVEMGDGSMMNESLKPIGKKLKKKFKLAKNKRRGKGKIKNRHI